jgi:hypothetical protein
MLYGYIMMHGQQNIKYVGNVAQTATVRYPLLIFMRDNKTLISEADEGKSSYAWPTFLLSLNNFYSDYSLL